MFLSNRGLSWMDSVLIVVYNNDVTKGLEFMSNPCDLPNIRLLYTGLWIDSSCIN